jgi:hypothetical protein
MKCQICSMMKEEATMKARHQEPSVTVIDFSDKFSNSSLPSDLATPLLRPLKNPRPSTQLFKINHSKLVISRFTTLHKRIFVCSAMLAICNHLYTPKLCTPFRHVCANLASLPSMSASKYICLNNGP